MLGRGPSKEPASGVVIGEPRPRPGVGSGPWPWSCIDGRDRWDRVRDRGDPSLGRSRRGSRAGEARRPDALRCGPTAHERPAEARLVRIGRRRRPEPQPPRRSDGRHGDTGPSRPRRPPRTVRQAMPSGAVIPAASSKLSHAAQRALALSRHRLPTSRRATISPGSALPAGRRGDRRVAGSDRDVAEPYGDPESPGGNDLASVRCRHHAAKGGAARARHPLAAKGADGRRRRGHRTRSPPRAAAGRTV